MLIVVTTLFFIGLYCAIYYYTVEQERDVYQTSMQQFDNEVNSLIELNSQTNTSNIVDMVYWDDFADYFTTRDKGFFEENIPTSLSTYQADYLGIYDVDGNFIKKSATGNIKSVDFIPKAVFPIIARKKILSFYIRIPEGYALVWGASVHPSIDIYKRVTRPKGYFFIVKLLNRPYFKNLETISGSAIGFVEGTETGTDTAKNLLIVKDIKDWKNNTINKIAFRRPFDISFDSTKKSVMLLFFATLAGSLVCLWFLSKWIYKPLKLVTKILEDGNEKDMEALRNVPGEFSYIGKLFRENDIQKNEISLARAKAEESDRLKSSFLTNMSHEIRTPMNAIVGFSELLVTENLTQSEQRDYIKIISNSGKNLVSIIEDLLDMSKIDTNQMAPNYSEVDVDLCVSELYDSIRILIPPDKDIDFSIFPPQRQVAGKIITDEVKLKQILTNLITNAIKYTKKGYVVFGYGIDPGHTTIEFTIKDSGIGIEKHYHELIFDRFHRIDNDFTIEAGGLGLGLAISKAYVEMLGGSIDIESNPEGGTIFSFTIPLEYSAVADGQKPEMKAGDTPGMRQQYSILVAEDDNINFLLIQKMLQLRQFNVIRAVDGQQAVDICKGEAAVDVILMDIKMPKLNGYEAFRQIKKLRPNIKIIAQTAYSSIEDKSKIETFGFDGYISKPIDKEKLFALIEILMKDKQRHNAT